MIELFPLPTKEELNTIEEITNPEIKSIVHGLLANIYKTNQVIEKLNEITNLTESSH